MGTSDGIVSPPAPSAGSGAGGAGTALAGAPELAAISAGFFPRVSFCVAAAASGFGEGPDEQAARTPSASNCFLIVGLRYRFACLPCAECERIQSNTVRYQSRLLRGFSTQWPSSGK